jgi:hypothetical protein
MAYEKPLGTLIAIDKYRSYLDLPLAELNRLRYPVYIVDYQWHFLFINDNAKKLLGALAEETVGRSAPKIFKDPVFLEVFDKLSNHLDKKLPLEVATCSPLRTSQTRVKGYPLDDCYMFCSIPMPAKADIMNELRAELKKKHKP